MQQEILKEIETIAQGKISDWDRLSVPKHERGAVQRYSGIKGFYSQTERYSNAYDFWYDPKDKETYERLKQKAIQEGNVWKKNSPDYVYSNAYGFWYDPKDKKTYEHLRQQTEDRKHLHRVCQKVWQGNNSDYWKELQKENPAYSCLVNLHTNYRIREHHWMELYEKQNGICLGCDMKLVSAVLWEERKQYDDDPNLIEDVDYSVAFVDHDHSMEKPKDYHPDYVRGLLCVFCNHHTVDPLNPESRLFIYGEDGEVNKLTIVTNRLLKKTMKELK